MLVEARFKFKWKFVFLYSPLGPGLYFLVVLNFAVTNHLESQTDLFSESFCVGTRETNQEWEQTQVNQESRGWDGNTHGRGPGGRGPRAPQGYSCQHPGSHRSRLCPALKGTQELSVRGEQRGCFCFLSLFFFPLSKYPKTLISAAAQIAPMTSKPVHQNWEPVVSPKKL